MVKSTTCDTAQNNYIAGKIAMTNAQTAYGKCIGSDPAYSSSSYTMALQPVVNSNTLRMNQVAPILQTINNQSVTYSALITSTKALIAATQPLKDYKSILQNQLNATAQENQSVQQQITTNANTMTQTMASIPDLSNAGPFGTANAQSGVGYAFLSFYSVFFLLLSAVIYIKFKNSVSGSLLITGIVLLLGAAGAGAYCCAVYGLGLQDPQSLITTLTV